VAKGRKVCGRTSLFIATCTRWSEEGHDGVDGPPPVKNGPQHKRLGKPRLSLARKKKSLLYGKKSASPKMRIANSKETKEVKHQTLLAKKGVFVFFYKAI